MIPIHLIGYSFVAALVTWRLGGEDYHKRYWDIRSFGEMICCGLSWRFGDNQLGSVQQVAYSAEEAVWSALQEFEKIARHTDIHGVY